MKLNKKYSNVQRCKQGCQASSFRRTSSPFYGFVLCDSDLMKNHTNNPSSFYNVTEHAVIYKILLKIKENKVLKEISYFSTAKKVFKYKKCNTLYIKLMECHKNTT